VSKAVLGLPEIVHLLAGRGVSFDRGFPTPRNDEAMAQLRRINSSTAV